MADAASVGTDAGSSGTRQSSDVLLSDGRKSGDSRYKCGRGGHRRCEVANGPPRPAQVFAGSRVI